MCEQGQKRSSEVLDKDNKPQPSKEVCKGCGLCSSNADLYACDVDEDNHARKINEYSVCGKCIREDFDKAIAFADAKGSILHSTSETIITAYFLHGHGLIQTTKGGDVLGMRSFFTQKMPFHDVCVYKRIGGHHNRVLLASKALAEAFRNAMAATPLVLPPDTGIFVFINTSPTGVRTAAVPECLLTEGQHDMAVSISYGNRSMTECYTIHWDDDGRISEDMMMLSKRLGWHPTKDLEQPQDLVQFVVPCDCCITPNMRRIIVGYSGFKELGKPIPV